MSEGEGGTVYRGQCFCGAVKYELSGAPLFSGHCHCQDCRDWGGSPFINFILVPWDAFSIVEGEEHLKLFARVPQTPRGSCALCGSSLGVFRKDAEPPHVGTSPHAFADFPFKPTMHVFCAQAVMPWQDDLPHYQDVPAELGGSGDLMSDSPSA